MATIARSRVTSDPQIMGGWPCVEGTRIPAETILAYLKEGASAYEIVSDYPTMPLGGVEAVEAWARENGRL